MTEAEGAEIVGAGFKPRVGGVGGSSVLPGDVSDQGRLDSMMLPENSTRPAEV